MKVVYRPHRLKGHMHQVARPAPARDDPVYTPTGELEATMVARKGCEVEAVQWAIWQAHQDDRDIQHVEMSHVEWEGFKRHTVLTSPRPDVWERALSKGLVNTSRLWFFGVLMIRQEVATVPDNNEPLTFSRLRSITPAGERADDQLRDDILNAIRRAEDAGLCFGMIVAELAQAQHWMHNRIQGE